MKLAVSAHHLASLLAVASANPGGEGTSVPTSALTGNPTPSPTIAPKLVVPRRPRFGKPIDVFFAYTGATKNDYIGIYNYDGASSLKDNPFHEDLQFYVYLCGSQSRVTCDALEEGRGVVTFDGQDPSEEYFDQWPPNPRLYKVCHMRQGKDGNGDETGELIQKCKRMEVVLVDRKREKVPDAQVAATKATYAFEEEVAVRFDAKFKSPNAWVGIYKPGELDREIMWLYTGCNNVQGDQGYPDTPGSSNDCLREDKKGRVTFGPNNTGRSSQDWPLPPGEYALRLNYYNNNPHDLFKDAEANFTVVDSY